MNKLIKKEENEMTSFQQLQVKMNEMIVMQQGQLNETLVSIQDEQKRQSVRLENVQKDHEDSRDLEIKRHRVEEHRFGFVSLNDLGQCYQVSVGAKTMGKLLRIVGLAKKKQSRTEPLRSATLNDYAKSKMYGNRPTYQWNPEKTIEKIDRWLDDKEIIDTFYGIEDEKELMEYINDLFEQYGN